MKLQFKESDIPQHLRKYFKPAGCKKGCYICHLIEIFAEVKRVLKKDGTAFVNLGDSFVGAASETPSIRDNSPIAKGTVQSQEQRNGRAERHKAQIAYGLRPKSLLNIPARFAIAMTDD